MCDKDTSGAHRCINYDRSIHVECGTVLSEEGYGSKVLCPNCKPDNNRVRHRSGAMDNQLKQANMMVSSIWGQLKSHLRRSDEELPEVTCPEVT